MPTLKIAVFGANGQLGKSLRAWQAAHPTPDQTWRFFDSHQADITDHAGLTALFSKEPSFDYVINCAAYTAVDNAEKAPENAFVVNADGPKILAELCHQHQAILIHISTDFVFDGRLSRPLTELDTPNPINTYGASKYKGETTIEAVANRYFILRTGWLYSNYNQNFYLTMRRLFTTKDHLNVVADQIGTPTHASVLVRAITTIINTKSTAFGLYHLTNEGVASWYDFAYEILNSQAASCRLFPISTKDYPTPAKRPAFSVLNNAKFTSEFKCHLPHWKASFNAMITSIN